MSVAFKLYSFKKQIERALSIFLGLLLGLLVLTEVLQVLGRYFFGFGFIWIQDVLSLSLLSLGWVGAGYLWINKSHLNVEIFRFRHSLVVDWIDPISDVLALLFAMYLLPVTVQAMVAYSSLKMDGLNVSASVKMLPCLVGLILLGIGAISNLLEYKYGASEQFLKDHD